MIMPAIRIFKNYIVVFLCSYLFIILPVIGCRINPLDGKIFQVENGLLPAMIVEGTPVETYSISDRMSYYQVPGISIAIINEGRIDWARGYGYASIEDRRLVNETTMFQAASISKPITAYAALTLVDDGNVDLEKDVNSYLDLWEIQAQDSDENNNPINLWHLLTHSSGFNNPGFPGYESGSEIPDFNQILNGEGPITSQPPKRLFNPGEDWRYSGYGYLVIQQLMTDVLNMSFPDIIDEKVFKPLDMVSSAYLQPVPDTIITSCAKGYNFDGTAVPGGWNVYPELAAAGLWSTPTDLAKWGITMQKAIKGDATLPLSPDMTKKMTNREYINFGLGVLLSGHGDSLAFTHNGGNRGFACDLFVYGHRGQGAIIMTNASHGYGLISEIYRSIALAYNWPDWRPETLFPYAITNDQIEFCIGAYKIQLNGNEQSEKELIFRNESGVLILQYSDIVYTLVAQEHNRFRVPELGWDFTFIGEDGQPWRSVRYFIDIGPGTADKPADS
jgi:CubicO group peptidase (beta-lactamase class C family)